MATDRELLELAAKAAGHKVHARAQAERDALIDPTTASLWLTDGTTAWNPLKHDSDALRLAVKLGIRIETWLNRPLGISGKVEFGDGCAILTTGDDPYAATRRAVTRAAAEIGAQTAPQPADPSAP